MSSIRQNQELLVLILEAHSKGGEMKKVHDHVYCSHCGDEIPPAELAMLSSSTCALCTHMHYEALQIMAERHESKPKKTVLHSITQLAVNTR